MARLFFTEKEGKLICIAKHIPGYQVILLFDPKNYLDINDMSEWLGESSVHMDNGQKLSPLRFWRFVHSCLGDKDPSLAEWYRPPMLRIHGYNFTHNPNLPWDKSL